MFHSPKILKTTGLSKILATIAIGVNDNEVLGVGCIKTIDLSRPNYKIVYV